MDDVIAELDALIAEVRGMLEETTVGPQAPREDREMQVEGSEVGGAVSEGGAPISARLFEEEEVRDDA